MNEQQSPKPVGHQKRKGSSKPINLQVFFYQGKPIAARARQKG